MTGLKRKASEDLSSSSLVVFNPALNSLHARPAHMGPTPALLSRMWEWCTGWCSTFNPVTNYADLTRGTNNSTHTADTSKILPKIVQGNVDEADIQIGQSGGSGAIPIKRQKTRLSMSTRQENRHIGDPLVAAETELQKALNEKPRLSFQETSKKKEYDAPSGTLVPPPHLQPYKRLDRKSMEGERPLGVGILQDMPVGEEYITYKEIGLQGYPQESGESEHKCKMLEDNRHMGGRGKLDISECNTEHEARERMDEFWRPRNIGLLNKDVRSASQIRLSNYPDLSLGEPHPDLLNRRHSDSLGWQKCSHDLLPSPESQPKCTPKSQHVWRPKTPQSQPQATAYAVIDSSKSIEARLGSLFLESEAQTRDNSLTLSSTKQRQREEAEKERKRRSTEAKYANAKKARLTRRFPLQDLVQPLSQAWEAKVQDAEFANHHQVITTATGGTELRSKDFKTVLGSRDWLNDEIINAYIEWVVEAANEKATADAIDEAKALDKELPSNTIPKFIAHNSFFIETLEKKGPSSTERLMKRKKAPGKSLMQVDTILVPICKGSHWTIGAVRPVARTIEYFDSMGGNPRNFIKLMRSWLSFQLGEAYIEDDWKEPQTACAHQSNGYDCGVFVCTNAFCVALGLDTSCYEERDMTLQRRNIAAILINRGFKGDFMWAREGL